MPRDDHFEDEFIFRTKSEEARNEEFEQVNTLHELLGLALDDMEKILKTPGYIIDMGRWHEPSIASTCRVCLAGSVIANRYADGPEKMHEPEDFSRAVQKRLFALNALRNGNIAAAWVALHLDHTAAGSRDAPYWAQEKTELWQGHLADIANATGNSQGRVLLGELRKLQADLKLWKI